MLLSEPVRYLKDIDNDDSRAKELSNHQVVEVGYANTKCELGRFMFISPIRLIKMHNGARNDPADAEGDLKEERDRLRL